MKLRPVTAWGEWLWNLQPARRASDCSLELSRFRRGRSGLIFAAPQCSSISAYPVQRGVHYYRAWRPTVRRSPVVEGPMKSIAVAEKGRGASLGEQTGKRAREEALADDSQKCGKTCTPASVLSTALSAQAAGTDRLFFERRRAASTSVLDSEASSLLQGGSLGDATL